MQNKFDNDSDFISINSEINFDDLCFVIRELMIKLVDEFNVDFILRCPFDSDSKQLNLKEVKLLTISQLCEIKETSFSEEEKFNKPRNIIRSYMEIKLDNLQIIKPIKNNLSNDVNININNNAITQLQNLENPRYIIRSVNENFENDNDINKNNNDDNNDNEKNNEKDINLKTGKGKKRRSKTFKNKNNNDKNKLNFPNNNNLYHNTPIYNEDILSISNSRNKNNENDNNASLSSSNSSGRQNSHRFNEEENDPESYKQKLYHRKNKNPEEQKQKISKLNIDSPVTDNKLVNKAYTDKKEYNELCRELNNLK